MIAPHSSRLPAFVRFLIAAVWVAVVFLGSGVVFGLLKGHNLLPALLYRLLGCALAVGGFAFLLRVLDLDERPLDVALGLPKGRGAVRGWLHGFALGAALMTADAAAIAVFGSLRLHWHINTGLLLRAMVILITLFCAALLEEICFRGYPFEKLVESLGAPGAVVVLSALFGALHLGNPNAGGLMSVGFWNTLLVGVLFALARLRTGNLWFPFGLHLGWNLFQGSVFGLPVSGLSDFATVVTATVKGSHALTGGSYGPEASTTCCVLLIVSLPVLWKVTARRTTQA
jgi:hypothetical protein